MNYENDEKKEIENIPLSFFEGIREKKKEKPEFKSVVDAEIIAVSDVKYNPENGEGINQKDKRKFKKFYFTITYLLAKPVNGTQEIMESYGFRFYEDDKSIWWGTPDSACGRLVSKLKKYTPKLPENPDVSEVFNALIGRKVKLITETFGPSKSKKIMIDMFL